MRYLHFVGISFVLLASNPVASAATIAVGPAGQYSKPCAGISAAQPGDIVEIDAAGDYTGDVCVISTSGLTMQGVNGRPQIAAGGNNAQGKGIWVIEGNNTTVENIEFTGAVVPDNNGAAIRQEGTNLTVRNCYIHNVTLTSAAPDGGAIVSIKSANPAAAPVPASITVPAGATEAAFTLRAGSVSQSVNVSITASYAGSTAQTSLTINPGH